MSSIRSSRLGRLVGGLEHPVGHQLVDRAEEAHRQAALALGGHPQVVEVDLHEGLQPGGEHAEHLPAQRLVGGVDPDGLDERDPCHPWVVEQRVDQRATRPRSEASGPVATDRRPRGERAGHDALAHGDEQRRAGCRTPRRSCGCSRRPGGTPPRRWWRRSPWCRRGRGLRRAWPRAAPPGVRPACGPGSAARHAPVPARFVVRAVVSGLGRHHRLSHRSRPRRRPDPLGAGANLRPTAGPRRIAARRDGRGRYPRRHPLLRGLVAN